MKNRTFKIVYNIIIALILILTFSYLSFTENGILEIIKNIKNFNYFWLFMAAFSHVISLTSDVFIIYLLIKNHVSDYKFKNAFKASYAGHFFNCVTPFSSGGNAVQVYIFKNQRVDTGTASSSLIQKFLVYQTVLIAYSAISVIVKYLAGNLGTATWFLTFIGFIVQAFVIILLLLFSFNKKLTDKIISGIFKLLGKLKIVKNPEEKIKNLEDQLALFYSGNKDLYKNFNLVLMIHVLTFIQITADFIVPYFVYRSFNLHGAKVLDMICTQVFITLITHFFPVPGSSGAAEGAEIIFMDRFFGSEIIKSAVLLIRLILYYLTIVITFPFSRLAKNNKKKGKFCDK